MLSRLTLRVLHHALLKSFEVEALKAVYFYLNDVLLVVKLCHEDAVGVELPVRNSFAPCVPHDLEELFCYHGDMVLAQVTPLLANEWQEAWRVHILTDQGHLLVTHKYVLKADDPFVLQLQQIRKLFNVVFSNWKRRICDFPVHFVVLQECEQEALLTTLLQIVWLRWVTLIVDKYFALNYLLTDKVGFNLAAKRLELRKQLVCSSVLNDCWSLVLLMHGYFRIVRIIVLDHLLLFVLWDLCRLRSVALLFFAVRIVVLDIIKRTHLKTLTARDHWLSIGSSLSFAGFGRALGWILDWLLAEVVDFVRAVRRWFAVAPTLIKRLLDHRHLLFVMNVATSIFLI